MRKIRGAFRKAAWWLGLCECTHVGHPLTCCPDMTYEEWR